MDNENITVQATDNPKKEVTDTVTTTSIDTSSISGKQIIWKVGNSVSTVTTKTPGTIYIDINNASATTSANMYIDISSSLRVPVGVYTALPNPNALTIQLAGGTTEGTNKFTYTGSAAKSLNITPASIGALGAVSANGYWGMATPDKNTSSWIRTSSQGLLPYQSGSIGSGHQGLGTSSWYFADAYIDNVNAKNYKLQNGAAVITYDNTNKCINFTFT